MTATEIINFGFEIYNFYKVDEEQAKLVLQEKHTDTDVEIFKEYLQEQVRRTSKDTCVELFIRISSTLNEIKQQEKETWIQDLFVPLYEVLKVMFSAINDVVEREVTNEK